MIRANQIFVDTPSAKNEGRSYNGVEGRLGDITRLMTSGEE